MINEEDCLFEYILKKAINNSGFENVYLATTKCNEDDLLCEIALKYKINIFRGSTKDKILRWKNLCEKFNISDFLCADGDDPFIDFALGKELIEY